MKANYKKIHKLIQDVKQLRIQAETELLTGFGEILRQKREETGLTQEDVAFFAELSRTSIANMEAGKQDTTITTLLRVAMALGCNPSDLLPKTEE